MKRETAQPRPTGPEFHYVRSDGQDWISSTFDSEAKGDTVCGAATVSIGLDTNGTAHIELIVR